MENCPWKEDYPLKSIAVFNGTVVNSLTKQQPGWVQHPALDDKAWARRRMASSVNLADTTKSLVAMMVILGWEWRLLCWLFVDYWLKMVHEAQSILNYCTGWCWLIGVARMVIDGWQRSVMAHEWPVNIVSQWSSQSMWPVRWTWHCKPRVDSVVQML